MIRREQLVSTVEKVCAVQFSKQVTSHLLDAHDGASRSGPGVPHPHAERDLFSSHTRE
jgi:hypothetical protein